MSIVGIIKNVTGIADKFTTVFIKERRRRARIKIEVLKIKKQKLKRKPANVKTSRKISKINAEIAKLENYLIEE